MLVWIVAMLAIEGKQISFDSTKATEKEAHG